ncbi:two-component system, LytT family, sensor histidine kinase AlgZ [Alteromonadaceae bacterium Bs31]|nr:two-component system, LytT family, sensor histidine kinase AlgZ [Alteromonadaceae bacterium Bs31]
MKESPQRNDDGDFLPDLCGPPQVLGLILVSELLVVCLLVAANGLRAFDWASFGMVSMLTQWIVLSSAACLCALRNKMSAMYPAVAGTLSYSITLLCTVLFSILFYWINNGILLGVWTYIVGNLMVAAVLSGIALRYLYLQQQLRNQQKAEMQSRIQALQSRIRPHFLFNSMNTIASLIAIDQDTAERVVVELSQLFRASLGEPGLIPLRKEIDLCRYYLDIEQMRLGERMSANWYLHDQAGNQLELSDERFTQRQIPSFLLQPLVENAIYHGIQPLPEGGSIHIDIGLSDSHVELCLRNPLPASSDQTAALDSAHRGNGIALENIRHRLAAYYEGAASFKVLSNSEEFIVKLRYPCSKALQSQRRGL